MHYIGNDLFPIYFVQQLNMSISNSFVEIQNFKSIEKRKVDFSSGVTLLKGASGAGKSTTLESVLYAISGAPRTCKSMDRPSASTRVKFTFDTASGETWSISRSTRPGRLVLERGSEQAVEDDEAQGVIDSLFGQKFGTVSHIPQNTSRSFMCMPPSAKLEFLEGITFGRDAAVLKEKSKLHLKEKKKASIRASAEHEVFEKEVKKHPPPSAGKSKPPTPPDGSEKQSQRDKQNARAAMSESREKVERLTREKNALVKKRSRSESARKELQLLQQDYQDISEDIQADAVCWEIEENDVQDALESAKDAVAAARQLNNLRARIPEWARGENWEEKAREWEKAKTAELKKNQSLIEKAETQDTAFFACPSCSAGLGYNRMTDAVHLADGGAPDGGKCDLNMRDLMRAESRIQSTLDKRAAERRASKTAAAEIKELVDEWGADALDDVRELENTVDEIKAMAAKITRKIALGKKIKKVKVIAERVDEAEPRKPEDVEAEIKLAKSSLARQRDQFDDADARVDRWNAWRREKETYDRRMADIDARRKARENALANEKAATVKLKSAALELMGAEELKSAVLEAESLALVSLVNQINDHAAAYLDVFFADDPIEASLKTFTSQKGKKKMKPSIQTEIQYKGNDMKMEGLSGGEQARVVVAFNLALCEILGSPIIMLDEVTANLDAELTETIYETIKAASENKIVLAVAHQCIDGTFDNIIHVN